MPDELPTNQNKKTNQTGPKTKEGKERSKLNGYRRGIKPENFVSKDENKNEFNRLRLGLEREFKPETQLEFSLVERMVSCLWRLRRHCKAEGQLISKTSDYSAQQLTAYMRIFSQFEKSLDNNFHRALRQLLEIKKASKQGN